MEIKLFDVKSYIIHNNDFLNLAIVIDVTNTSGPKVESGMKQMIETNHFTASSLSISATLVNYGISTLRDCRKLRHLVQRIEKDSVFANFSVDRNIVAIYSER
jgi:hypothetical protein